MIATAATGRPGLASRTPGRTIRHMRTTCGPERDERDHDEAMPDVGSRADAARHPIEQATRLCHLARQPREERPALDPLKLRRANTWRYAPNRVGSISESPSSRTQLLAQDLKVECFAPHPQVVVQQGERAREIGASTIPISDATTTKKGCNVSFPPRQDAAMRRTICGRNWDQQRDSHGPKTLRRARARQLPGAARMSKALGDLQQLIGVVIHTHSRPPTNKSRRRLRLKIITRPSRPISAPMKYKAPTATPQAEYTSRQRSPLAERHEQIGMILLDAEAERRTKFRSWPSRSRR